MSMGTTDRPPILGPGDHVAFLYEGEAEHRDVMASFLSGGLERHEKVLYIVDTHTPALIVEYLQALRVTTTKYLASEQLNLLSPEATYLQPGYFSPEAMIGLLREETSNALEDGYTALRATGEMTWSLRGGRGTERLIEYESQLNQSFFLEYPCLGLCQYDLRQFEPKTLLNVLATHPKLLIGGQVYDNLYYIPPAAFTSTDLPAATLRQWVQNLKAQRQTQDSLHRLHGVMESLLRRLESSAN